MKGGSRCCAYACGQIRVVESRGKVSGRPDGWRLAFDGGNDCEFVLRGILWADNCWLFCDNEESLVAVVNNVVPGHGAQAGVAVVGEHAIMTN